MSNAYATGRRSVAVTSRVVEGRGAGRLPEEHLVVVLVHEMGHAVTGTAAPLLFLAWLGAPWRWAAALLTGLASMLAGRQPRRGFLVVVIAGWAVAVARAVNQRQWRTGGVQTFLALAAVFVTLAEAAVSRRAEYAADHGLAVQLAAALHRLDDASLVTDGRWRRLRASPPTPEERIRVLLTAAGHPVDVCHVVCQRGVFSPVPARPPKSTHPA